MPYFKGGETLPGPRFLQALDDVTPLDDGYVAQCPICRELLLIEDVDGGWCLACDGNCSHDEIQRWLEIASLRVDPDWDDRAWMCMMLAPSIEIWQKLRAEVPVDPACLDQVWLQRFRSMGIM